ncbi:MAG: hypothetical protein RIT81_38865 [Deltaproteobacteria bacterium]
MRWGCLLLCVAACSPGVGREPEFPDGGPVRDVGPRDSGPGRDAGFRDGGRRDANVTVRDGGPPEMFPFTGIFEIYDSAQTLYARELDGELMLIVDAPPYVFVGTIDEEGRFDLTSPVLDASGCNRPSITGEYERTSTLYRMDYRACNGQLQVIEAELRGLFLNDYDHQRSGVYEVDATVFRDTTGCWTGNVMTSGWRWATFFLDAGNTAIVFTASDFVDPPNVYVGTYTGGSFAYTATHYVTANVNGERYAMSGGFMQPTLNDPLVMSGMRDVYNPNGPNGPCFFTINYAGERVASP